MPKKSAPGPDADHPQDWNYEVAVQTVETVINQLETGNLPLADVFEQFAAAVTQLQQCDQFLKQKQAEAQLLIETLTDNQ